MNRRFAVSIWSLLIFGLASCSSSDTISTPPPPPPPPLGAACLADTVRLATLNGVSVDCSAGTTVTLAGGGAAYLVVPQLASGGIGTIAYQSQPFTLSVGGTVGALATTPSTSRSTRVRPGRNQQLADELFRGRDRTLVPLARRANAGSRRLALAPAATPTLGAVQSFHVAASIDGNDYKTVSAALRYIGPNVYVYLDTATPANGFTDGQLAGFGQLFDQVLLPLDQTTFGAATDIDGNGHVIVLLTPAVNALTPAASCSTEGFVTGFFDGNDFTTDANSNQGEIFYSLVPDPTGSVSCAHAVADVTSFTPAVFLHEVQHMISFGQHVAIHGGDSEEGWLDEGLSLVAEELGAQYYEAKFPPPSGRSSPGQIFPDSAEGFIADKLIDSYDYLTRPDTVSLTLHSDSDGGLAWRAGDWLLFRYVGDQFGQSIYKTLDESNLTGTANLAAATGTPFSSLLGNFSIAVYTDSLPGLARDQIPSQYRFKTRNLRQLYQAVYLTYGPINGFPAEFPITVQSFTPNGGPIGTLVPGAASYYGLVTQSTTTAVTLQFGSPTGTTFGTSLHPLLNVFRIQ